MNRTRLEWLAAFVLIAAGAWLRLRIAYHWVFAGSDSYGYIRLADQLWQHGRFALSPTDAPHLGRMPLYPIFVALTKRSHPAEMSGGDGWFLITNAQIYLELAMLVLVYLMARRLGGRVAGLAALALAALVPFNPLYSAAVLTESLATSLTTAAIAALVLGSGRPKLWFPVAGALVALATLVRPDSIMLACAFLPALFLADRAGETAEPELRLRDRRRLKLAGASLLAFSVVFSPWIVRNLSAFGHPYVLGSRTDRFARTQVNWHGWWRWINAWGRDDAPQTFLSTCFYNPPCSIGVEMFPPEAFDSPEEQKEVARLLAQRARQGSSASVSEGFEALGAARERSHPLRSFIGLPISRAVHMWISRFDELLQHPTLWGELRAFGRRMFMPMTVMISLAILLGTAVLAARRRTRALGLTLALPIFVRTTILSFTGYSLPRYTVEMLPIAFVLIAWGAVEAVHWRRENREAPR